MGKTQENKLVRAEFNIQAIAAGIRMPNGVEMQLSQGHLVMDVVLVANPHSVVVGHFVIPAKKGLKIGKKFNAKIVLEELSEEEYVAMATEGLIEVNDIKNKDVGIV